MDLTKHEWIQCDCPECRNMCIVPCWPTFAEAEILIDEGYSNKLVVDYWWGSRKMDCVKALRPLGDKEVCCFQQEDGLCSLHDLGLKPMEGKLALCKKRTPKDLRDTIAETWACRIAQQFVRGWEAGCA